MKKEFLNLALALWDNESINDENVFECARRHLFLEAMDRNDGPQAKVAIMLDVTDCSITRMKGKYGELSSKSRGPNKQRSAQTGREENQPTKSFGI